VWTDVSDTEAETLTSRHAAMPHAPHLRNLPPVRFRQKQLWRLGGTDASMYYFIKNIQDLYWRRRVGFYLSSEAAIIAMLKSDAGLR